MIPVIFLIGLIVILILVVVFLLAVISMLIGRNRTLARDVDKVRDKYENVQTEFLSNISHELRTPINTITGMSEIILQNDLNDEMEFQVNSIQITGHDLLEKINDLIDYTQIRDGKIRITEHSYNISSTINDVISQFADTAYDKGLELIVDCDPNIPSELIGDEPKIRRIMQNIIDNALKFTSVGCATVSVGFRPEDYGGNLNIRVKDTGIGMKKKDIGQIFDGFYQVISGTSRSAGGMGLGLSVSYAIVKAMGGFLSVDSEEGRGTTISITIPQRVYSSVPAISVANTKELYACCYLNLEGNRTAEVRDDFLKTAENLARGLGVRYSHCMSFEELCFRIEKSPVTTVFIGYPEYQEHTQFFKDTAQKIVVCVILPRNTEIEQTGMLIPVYKPFYSLAVANIFNTKTYTQEFTKLRRKKVSFYAPTVRAMIVDDNIMNLRVAQGLLKKYRIKSTIVMSGDECLTKLTPNSYDIVFMDHMMPEMDGVECVHRIRRRPEEYYSRLPIVALTANAIDNAREMFLSEGFNDFVSKPIDNLCLEDALLRMIPVSMRIDPDEAVPESDTEKTTETVPEAETTPALSIPGIDMDTALGFFDGDEDMFREMASMYLDVAAEKLARLKEFFAAEDWAGYRIDVHALKSNSNNIGALELGERSRELEMLCKDFAEASDDAKDEITSKIRLLHPALISDCEVLFENMRKGGIA